MKLKFNKKEYKDPVILKSNGLDPNPNPKNTKFLTNEELDKYREEMDEIDFLNIAISDIEGKLSNNEQNMDSALSYLNLMTDLPDQVIAVINESLSLKDSRMVTGFLKSNIEVSKIDKVVLKTLELLVSDYIKNKSYFLSSSKKLKKYEETKIKKEAEIRGKTPL